MSQKKELSLDELEEVTGGKIGTDDPRISNFTGFVNMYCLKENQEYYFVKSNDNWFRGTVTRTYEKYISLVRTLRTHEVTITELGTLKGDWQIGFKINVTGDDNAVYTTKIA